MLFPERKHSFKWCRQSSDDRSSESNNKYESGKWFLAVFIIWSDDEQLWSPPLLLRQRSPSFGKESVPHLVDHSILGSLCHRLFSRQSHNDGDPQAKHMTGIPSDCVVRRMEHGLKACCKIAQPWISRAMLAFFLMGSEDGKCWGRRWISRYF